MLAYHWLTESMTAGHGDEPAWTEGEERTIKGRKKIVICQHGYHSSPTPFDGLEYAPGPILCLVEIGEPVESQPDKHVSKTRKLIKAIDVSQQLREFACDVAEEALNREVQAGRTVDERSRAAIEVARRYARKQATPEELAAAWDAARDAAYAAYAARAAAWAAARAAARDAARAAAWAAWDAQKVKFNATMEAILG